MSKEEIRQRAAIAVLPECVRTCNEVLSRGGKLTEETQAKQAAMMAVAYADELAEKLSNLEQNGKDLQLAVNEEIKRRCDAIDAKEMGKEYFRSLPGSDYYAPERLHNRTVEHREAYKQGVIDTIKKLKGE